MKKIGIAMVLLFTVVATGIAQEIKWVTFDEAVKLQAKKPKKIMMDVYTEWCGPCKMLDKNTFQNADVVKYVNDNYYAVKFNAEGNEVINYQGKTFNNPGYKAEMAKRRNGVHNFTRALQVSAYPTIMFFDEKANVISPLKGYQNPQQLELYLKMFKDDSHKVMKTQDDFNAYYTKFTPKFKG